MVCSDPAGHGVGPGSMSAALRAALIRSEALQRFAVFYSPSARPFIFRQALPRILPQ